MSSSETNKSIIDKTLRSLDWDDIVKMYKILGIKVGGQPMKIEGLVKKEKVDAESVKSEIEIVLNYVVENDVPELRYGPWTIYWVNGEWEIEIESEYPDGEPLIVPLMESKMEILFTPQSTIVREFLDIEFDDDQFEEEMGSNEEELMIFEARLKKAISDEDWMVASRLRDLIDELKKKKDEN